MGNNRNAGSQARSTGNSQSKKKNPRVVDPKTNGSHRVETYEPDPLLSTRADLISGRKETFLWRGRILEGSLTCLSGRKGSGKSTVAAAIAADVTGGPRLNGGKPRHHGHVLWLGAEEPVKNAVVERLKANGAILKNVSILNADKKGVNQARLSLPNDIPRLRRTIKETDTGLLIFDPWTGCLSDGLLNTDEQSLRKAFEPLIAMASELNVSVLLLAHLSKKRGGFASDQILGGVGFVNMCRSVLRCDQSPDDPKTHLLSVVQKNFGGDSTTLTFQCEAAGEMVAKLRWTGTSEFTADTLAELAMSSDDERSEAEDLLRRATHQGYVPVNDLIKAARGACISESTIRRAKRKLKMDQKWNTDTVPRFSEWGPPKEGW